MCAAEKSGKGLRPIREILGERSPDCFTGPSFPFPDSPRYFTKTVRAPGIIPIALNSGTQEAIQ